MTYVVEIYSVIRSLYGIELRILYASIANKKIVSYEFG